MMLKIKDLVLDPELYPRLKQSWLTIFQYSEAMKMGQVFPPIIVGKIKGKQGLHVIDGWTRLKATQNLGRELIDCTIRDYPDFKSAFIDSVQLNMRHGQRLSVQERVRLIDKFKGLKMDENMISELLSIPIERIESFEIKRIVHSISGETIYLKSPLKNSSLRKRLEEMESSEIELAQNLLSQKSQIQILNQLINLLEGNLLIKDKKTLEQVKILSSLLSNYIVQYSDVNHSEVEFSHVE